MRLEVDITGKTFESAAGGTHEVLAPIKFALQSGEVGVLIGPSGCGKSTMLRIILGLDRDFDGSIARPPEARIGMVFQEPRLLPWRSVEQNVRLAAPGIGDAKLSELFRTLELEQHRSHFPGELSLGLARRVALARAFAVEPDLLVLDEPLASLDDALAGRLRDEIASMVGSRPVMTLLVTHSIDDAIRLGDRLFFLSPRPAHIVREVPISIPRAERSEAELGRIRAELAALPLESK
ncbi:ABC transporter ATP-binding protein [Bradyrhizobium sp. LTSP857]|uniref:ABC transporter ATP-binding protein n=1 Tax=Bradyrhizobium sp. LTSP857 TaxID=1619231 RepID=UPI0005D22B1E|nr:ABC transporter ATP-binding protein [Bradyrhizobium sp. LTSP857]KJC39903.1 ABC transporter ATP-binding protein [Bradyrhizobium sp. LTSP857]